MTQKQIVLVEWMDSHYVPGWHDDAPLTEPKLCRSVGWLMHDGPKAITLAAHMTVEDDPQRSGEMTIPTVAVIRVTPLPWYNE
jgi:hypothetical protein